MEGFVKFSAMSASDDGVMPAGEYLQKTLNMNNPDGYFQGKGLLFLMSNKWSKKIAFC
ncbi:hypothetical protein MJ588_19250 [Klebsiella pneumoniae]|nr:hypothetical protein MJ588_19250 [Klebsiella pneumoniae]